MMVIALVGGRWSNAIHWASASILNRLHLASSIQRQADYVADFRPGRTIINPFERLAADSSEVPSIAV
jgi:hypothetical protein